MVLINNIAVDKNVEYCGFLDGNGNFNIVSDLTDETGYNLTVGMTGYFRVSSEGFVQEFEVVNSTSSQILGFSLKEPASTVKGVPVISVKEAIPNNTNPSVVINGESAYVLISDNRIEKVDIALKCGQTTFFATNMELIAVKVERYIKDPDGQEQKIWLSTRGIL